MTEFRSLAGSVTVTSLATPPRRISLSFDSLTEDDARWLEALARRVTGPAPFAVIEPVALNLLDGPQSQGYGPLGAYETNGGGALSQRADRQVTIGNTSSTSALRWRHPYWSGWPVVAGARLGFAAALAPLSGVCALDYLDAGGALLGSSPQGVTVYDLPPAGTVFVRPTVRLVALPAPVLVGPAWLSMDVPAQPGVPVPLGDGCPAMTVTSYSDKPRPWGRDLSLDLVEVRRARS
ncbi:hypothetical protein UK23_15495 [Lentzea aerocolonigenes]|uniref:Uncharacterized protein n=1 Tax=Lentzea aerocolonigenes TaxID=68170 RepID=A0A0F0H5Q4_LENAE|nr:hypothetical protein [Lentzea aerocolonigenes]KJK48923.1 hypothetical protein UK23_15495 [Lentzea aerocolonigenes]